MTQTNLLAISADLKKKNSGPVDCPQTNMAKAYFPLGDFVRATRSENMYPAT